ncbi:UNVERIFIED_CONTAM: hypothetical protein RMT77_008615 [Armadillidium vulgare]
MKIFGLITSLLIIYVNDISCDPIDIESTTILKYLKNRSIVETQMKCLVGGSCDFVGNILLDYVPYLFTKEECYVCSDLGKRNIKLVTAYLMKYYPKCYKILYYHYYKKEMKPPIPVEGCTEN